MWRNARADLKKQKKAQVLCLHSLFSPSLHGTVRLRSSCCTLCCSITWASVIACGQCNKLDKLNNPYVRAWVFPHPSIYLFCARLFLTQISSLIHFMEWPDRYTNPAKGAAERWKAKVLGLQQLRKAAGHQDRVWGAAAQEVEIWFLLQFMQLVLSIPCWLFSL